MNDKYSISKIDPKKYPVILNIQNNMIRLEKELKSKKFANISSNYAHSINLCDKLKKSAINKKDEYCANTSYILKENIWIIKNIALFWKYCEEHDYNLSWSSLQDSINNCETLLKFGDEDSRSFFMQIYDYLLLIEKLYPYRIFGSPAYEEIKIKCSICGKSPYDPECFHITGKLYWGKMAGNVVYDIKKINHVALVQNPANKRSIIKIEYDKNDPEKSPFKHVFQFIKHSKQPLVNGHEKLIHFYPKWSRKLIHPQ